MRGWDRDAFLAALAERGTVKDACRAVGISRSTAYEERQRNEKFAVAWHDVNEAFVEALEREAFRRAVKGVERPVVSSGRLLGTVTEYSDPLLIFLLKAMRPEMYRDRVHVVHVPSGRSEQLDLARLSDDELETFERLLAKATKPDVPHTTGAHDARSRERGER